MNHFNIGELNISWNPAADVEIEEDNFSCLFQLEEEPESQDIRLDGREMDLSWFDGAQCLTRTGGYELLRTPRGLFVMNHWGNCRYGYGIWQDEIIEGDTLPVYFNAKMKAQPPLHMTRFLSTIGLHSKLLQKSAPIIHASYIVHRGKAILFTAPSQTGKTTQAELWVKYAGAQIINGDRVLLREKEGTWKAYGYPCCGSSDICINRNVPIAAIVVLEQGRENRVGELSHSSKMRALVSATELYPWDAKELDMAFALAEQLAGRVPVIKLACRPDAEAVEVLKEYLEENVYDVI